MLKADTTTQTQLCVRDRRQAGKHKAQPPPTLCTRSSPECAGELNRGGLLELQTQLQKRLAISHNGAVMTPKTCIFFFLHENGFAGCFDFSLNTRLQGVTNSLSGL